MTQRSAREARIHLISEGVIASYIQDISTSAAVGAPPAAARRHVSERGARAQSRRRRHRRPLAVSPTAARA
jgi:hypothetical protein